MSGVADRFQFHAFGWGLMFAFFGRGGGVRGWISYRKVGRRWMSWTLSLNLDFGEKRWCEGDVRIGGWFQWI